MSKLNIVTRLQHWMDSVPGQTFLNYAYSWGAAIVILGALFKLTHLPGGNIMLFLGMGTEALVFFLAAFDRPFDKKEIGKELPKDFETDEGIERAEGLTVAQETAMTEEFVEETLDLPELNDDDSQPSTTTEACSVQQTDTTPAVEMPSPTQSSASAAGIAVAQVNTGVNAEVHPEVATTVAPAIAAHYEAPEGQESVAQSAQQLSTIIRLANDELLRRTQAVLSPEMEAATEDYIAKLRTLNETLSKVDEQSARLTRDSQEMENLNRTLIGINKVYDLHFASISRQVTTIEEINNQTQQLAAKIEEVNRIYTRMMQTLNVMGNPMASANEAQ